MTRTGLCLATLGMLIASAASAQGPAPAAFKVISPIFGQLVTFSMPANFVGGFRSACPDSFAAQGFGPTKFGDQDAYAAVASCGSVGTDRHGETALIVASEAAPYPSCAVKG